MHWGGHVRKGERGVTVVYADRFVPEQERNRARSGRGRTRDRLPEDEPLLRMGAATMLEDAGFELVEAGSAQEALTILESRDDIHLVFSDIDMPNGTNGIKLAALARDRWPPVEIVLTSGNVTPDVGALPARGVFLPKPYRSEQVVAALRRFGKARNEQA